MSSASRRLSLQVLRHVAGDDLLRQALDDRRLADAGLADDHRVVLGAPVEDLHHALDLVVAADHRVELALARRLASGRRCTSPAPGSGSRPSASRRARCRAPPAARGRCAPCRCRTRAGCAPTRRRARRRWRSAGARRRRTRPSAARPRRSPSRACARCAASCRSARRRTPSFGERAERVGDALASARVDVDAHAARGRCPARPSWCCSSASSTCSTSHCEWRCCAHHLLARPRAPPAPARVNLSCLIMIVYLLAGLRPAPFDLSPVLRRASIASLPRRRQAAVALPLQLARSASISCSICLHPLVHAQDHLRRPRGSRRGR